MGILVKPSHAGEILKEDFLEPMGLSILGFSRAIRVDRQRIQRIIKGESGITPDTALRFAKALNTTPEFWMSLHTNYEMAAAREEVDVSEVEVLAVAAE